MIIFRRRLFSIYSIDRINDELKVNCSKGTLHLRKTSLEKIKSEIFKNNNKLLDDNNREESKKILAYDVFTDDGKRIGIVQLSENSAVEVELDWINLNDTTGEYFISLLEYFINLAKSSRYRTFILGLYRYPEEIKDTCFDKYGFVSGCDGKIKGVTILYKPL